MQRLAIIPEYDIQRASALPLINAAVQLREFHNPTVRRVLQSLHPHCTDGEISHAIKLAAEFEQECMRQYAAVPTSNSVGDDCRSAVDRAKLKYPQYLEVSYTYAFQRCAMNNR